jgi:probable F420-dependent oxidoreductase
MKFDASLPPVPLTSVPEIARAAEAMGFDALWTSETMHDPFLPGVSIAEHTQRLHFGTSVAIAFARSPGNLAYIAWDLAQASKGRFILGLGTQVKAHVVRRFGMSWPDSVVGQLREQIDSMRALWTTWQTGVPLNFRGEYYKLNLMTPFFNPGPIDHPEIPIYLAGVNTGLARLAGEVADGFLVHPLHSQRYIREVLLPAIQEGAVKAGRSKDDIKLCTHAFVVSSPEEDTFVRAQIAFYASTPSYRAVMALHGWEDVAEQLSVLVRKGQWAEMTALIDDQILSTFTVIASPDKLAGAIRERYQGLVDRLGLYLPFIPGERDEFWREMLHTLKS